MICASSFVPYYRNKLDGLLSKVITTITDNNRPSFSIQNHRISFEIRQFEREKKCVKHAIPSALFSFFFFSQKSLPEINLCRNKTKLFRTTTHVAIRIILIQVNIFRVCFFLVKLNSTWNCMHRWRRYCFEKTKRDWFKCNLFENCTSKSRKSKFKSL